MKQIRNMIVAITFFIVSKAAYSDGGACQYVAPGQSYSSAVSDFSCAPPFGGGLSYHSNAELLKIQIDILNGIHSELKNMKSSVDALTNAVNGLTAANKDFVAKNKEWQSNTLYSAIGKIEKIPATILANSQLINTLTTQVSENLATDKEFINKVKDTKKEN
ncbi:MAG: hypothetical protein PHO08_07155 [Methylococcales bacterium]|nr:hypothetical protein [Methylococcales bacterium]MDD5631826.1 hypothetical protein [Methylococcales bacterium]